MGKEEQLLEQKQLREKVIGRLEVLDKVGELLMLGSTDCATTNQVANYYGVTTRHIEELISNNRDELISDGFGLRKADDFITELNFGNKVNKKRGKFEVEISDGEIMSFAPRGVNLFPKRAILRIGMLLRDSLVAKEIRTRLLDIIHDVEKENHEIVENVVQELTEEKQLIMDKAEAEYNGDYDKVSFITAKLFALKNKRILELENEVDTITTHKLTLTESRNVINKLVRLIAIKEYGSMFGKAYGELYKTINYKLGINIKARDKKKKDSYLNTLTEDETFNVEEIVRTWANKIGINVDKELSLAN